MDRRELNEQFGGIMRLVQANLEHQFEMLRDKLAPAEPPLPEKCPKCGEGIHHKGTTEKTKRAWAVGKCGSAWWSDHTFCERTDKCRIRELEQQNTRLQGQRDRAWRALANIESLLGSYPYEAPRVGDFALYLAHSRGPDDCDDWNAVVEAAKAGDRT